MTAIVALSVVAVAALGVVAWQLWLASQERARMLDQWRAEVREVTTRAIRPDLIPVPKAPRPPAGPPRPVDEIAKVGTVSHIPPGNGDAA